MSDLVEKICNEIDAAREELVTLCAALVAAPSVNPPGRTAEVAPIVRGYLAGEGIPCETVQADDEAPNVIATITGGNTARTSGGRHVIYNAHMDTMEAGDESAWTVPVMRLTRRDGRLYGLGMGNMKGALAAMCLASGALHRHRAAWNGRLTMTAVSDEVMFGERGTVYLLRKRPDLAGDFLISGEGPGFMGLAPAEKGLLWLDLDVRAGGGHASRALRGETAVMKLAAVLARLDAMNDTYATLPDELVGVSGGEGNLGLRLSLNAGTIAAGTVRSQVATRARAEIDIRLPPGITAEACTEMIRKEPPGVSVAVVNGWNANWTALDHPLVVALAAAAQAIRGEKPPLVVRLPGSDARRWRDLGVPAVCYGPQPTLSAGIDDYVNEQDVVDCAKIYARAALALMGEAARPAGT
ncbi:MAG: M20 family metallopeptidase [Alphaproteobacteria bacterium]|nr:MAG: M20 family metallopeptidase [Alphaproteobacteria bacterium]